MKTLNTFVADVAVTLRAKPVTFNMRLVICTSKGEFPFDVCMELI